MNHVVRDLSRRERRLFQTFFKRIGCWYPLDPKSFNKGTPYKQWISLVWLVTSFEHFPIFAKNAFAPVILCSSLQCPTRVVINFKNCPFRATWSTIINDHQRSSNAQTTWNIPGRPNADHEIWPLPWSLVLNKSHVCSLNISIFVASSCKMRGKKNIQKRSLVIEHGNGNSIISFTIWLFNIAIYKWAIFHGYLK